MTAPVRTSRQRRSGRAAPKGGYGTEGKAKYREAVWTSLRLHARTGLRHCRVLLMPSSEGTEIEVAERYGVQRRNIVAVDSNRAIAATISRKYPGVRAWGENVFDAAERASREGLRFDVVHLDLTSNLGTDTLDGLTRFALNLKGDCLVAVNVLKGRESRECFDGNRERFIQHQERSLQEMSKSVGAPPGCGWELRVGGDLVMTSQAWRNLITIFRSNDILVSDYLKATVFHSIRQSLIPLATGWYPVTAPVTYRAAKAPMQWAVFSTTRRQRRLGACDKSLMMGKGLVRLDRDVIQGLIKEAGDGR